MKLVRVLLVAMAAGGISLVVTAPEAVAQVCASGLPGGGGGGGIPGLPPGVPTLSTGITALLVAVVAGLGGWGLRRSGRGLGGTLASGLLAVIGVPGNVRARVLASDRPPDGAERALRRPRPARVVQEPWRRPGRARRAGLVVLASSLLAVLLAPSPAGASHASGWSSISVEEGWDYNQPSWWTEWELDWESRRGLDVQCGPTSGGDDWGCTAHRPHKFLWTGYAEAPDGSGKGWEQLSMELLQSSSSWNGPWSWEATAWVDCFGTGSSSHYCSYPDNSVHPFNWRMNTPTTPPQSQWKSHETVWGENKYFWVDIGGNYYHSGTQYFLGDGVDPRNYTFLVDDLGTWPDIVTNKQNIPPVLTLGVPNNQDLHRCGTPEFDQDFTVSATDAEGHNWTAYVQVWDPDGVRIVNETTAKTASGSSVSTAAVKLTKDGTYTWSATPTDTSGESTATGSTVSGSFDFIFNLPPEVPTLVAPTSDDPDNPALVLDTQAPSFVIETADPEEDDYQGLVQVQKVDDPLALPIEAQTTQAKSGTQAVAQLDAPLAPGSYQWRANATDVLTSGTSEPSAFSAWEPFEVVRSVTNGAPLPPSLVAPTAASFAHGAEQTFTINATDPDGDDYLGVVTVTDTATGEETSFTTETAASGADSSGSPAVPLAAGDYEWSAGAVDSRGAAGAESAQTGTFSVDPPPLNLAPAASLVSPAEGHDYQHRDLQVFTVRGDDPEGDPYRASVRVDGTEVCATPLAPSGAEASCSPVDPVDPGAHSWTAVPTDLDGHEGDAPLARDFTVLANRAPGAPSLVEPPEGHTFAVGEPQMFAINATDPDGDSYSGEVIVRNAAGVVVDTVETAGAPSGFNSYGVATPPLAPGQYTFTAAAIDVGDERSDESPEERSFSVNTPPDVPTLVAPTPGHTFEQGDDQSFTVTATDPDGHPYRASVTIRQADTGAPVLMVSSPEVASGASATVTTPVDLPPGDYTWEATASDAFGGTSTSSPAREFNVAGSLNNLPPDPPVLVSPGDNTEHPYGDPDRFVVRATDPNDDPYTATITIWNATTDAVVATIEAGPAASGVETSGRPPDFLAIGSYEWSAHATDLRGEPGDESDRASFTVVAADP